MKQILFQEKSHGIFIERIVRDYEFSMPIKHMHAEYEIYYMLEGERYYFIEDDTYHIKTGTLVFIDRNEIHKTGSAGTSSYHDRIMLSLTEQIINPFLHKLGYSSLEYFFAHQRIFPMDETNQNYLNGLFEFMRRELRDKEDGYEDMVKLKIVEMLLFLSRCQKKLPTEAELSLSTSAKHKKVREATTYIRENYQSALSLQVIAEQLYVSKGYLSRIFREVTGVNVTDYINIQRIKYAKELLTGSKSNITEISELTGYDSITYFEKVFHKYTGTSPLKYRQALK